MYLYEDWSYIKITKILNMMQWDVIIKIAFFWTVFSFYEK